MTRNVKKIENLSKCFLHLEVYHISSTLAYTVQIHNGYPTYSIRPRPIKNYYSLSNLILTGQKTTDRVVSKTLHVITFTFFFQNRKTVTLLRFFLLCCIRFLERYMRAVLVQCKLTELNV